MAVWSIGIRTEHVEHYTIGCEEYQCKELVEHCSIGCVEYRYTERVTVLLAVWSIGICTERVEHCSIGWVEYRYAGGVELLYEECIQIKTILSY